MRRVLSFAAALSLLASAAAAQTPPETPAQAPAAPAIVAEPAAAATTPKAGDTVSGVTVMSMPKKTCAPRDKECVALVVAELQRLYPEQLKQFCFAEQTKAVRNQMVGDQLQESFQGNHPSTPHAFPVSAIVKTACAPEKK